MGFRFLSFGAFLLGVGIGCSAPLPATGPSRTVVMATAPRAIASPAASLPSRTEPEQAAAGVLTGADEPPIDGDEGADTAGEEPVAESDLVSLPVPGFRAATLAVPRGDAPFRLVVAAHGAGGNPEATCNSWSRRTRGRALIACPRGRAMSDLEERGFYYPDHHTLEAEVLAVLAAIEARYAQRLSKEDAIYSGFSQGATMGALFLPGGAARFKVLVLTEGGYGDWTQRTAQRFHDIGGERVLFVCGTRHCAASVAKSARVLTSAGVTVRTENVSGGGHTDRGSVGERLDSLIDWAFSCQS